MAGLFEVLNIANPAQSVQPNRGSNLMNLAAELGNIGSRGITQATGGDIRSQQQKVTGASQGIDPNNPQSLRQLAQRLNDIGESQRSMAVLQAAVDLEKTQAKELQTTTQTANATQSLYQSLLDSGRKDLADGVATGHPKFLQAGIEFLKTYDPNEADASRETATDVNGRLRYLDTGELVFTVVTKDDDTTRPTLEDVNGRHRYVDTGELVFGDVTEDADGSDADRETATDVNGILRYLDDGSQVFEGVTKNAPAVQRRIQEDINGVQRFVDTGEAVFPNVAKDPEAPEGPADQRDRRIAELRRLYGKTEEEAISIVDTEIKLDPLSGNLISIDPLTREATIMDVTYPNALAASPTVDYGLTVDELSFNAGKGVGLGSGFLRTVNATVGQLPFIPVATEPEEAAQTLRVLQNDIVRALAISGRPPVIEQERLVSLMPKPNAFLENPEVANNKMVGVTELLTQQYVDDLRFIADPRNDTTARNDARSRANEIKKMIGRILTPEATASLFATVEAVNVYTKQYGGMTREELLAEQGRISEMSTTERSVYAEMLRRQRIQ